MNQISRSLDQFYTKSEYAKSFITKINSINDFKHYSSSSNYFIKAHHDFVLDIFKQIDFNKVKYNTAGNPSISPSELVELFVTKAIELKYIDKNTK